MKIGEAKSASPLYLDFLFNIILIIGQLYPIFKVMINKNTKQVFCYELEFYYAENY